LLILLCVHHADAGAELLEANTRQWLGEDVRELVTGADMLHDDLARFHALTDVVVPHFDVLTPVMEDGVLAQLNCGFVIDVDPCGAALVADGAKSMVYEIK
jgi:hypothetical protein